MTTNGPSSATTSTCGTRLWSRRFRNGPSRRPAEPGSTSLPSADAAGVDVDEILARVEADAAPAELDRRPEKAAQGRSRDPHVDRLPDEVEAVRDDAAPAVDPEVFVGARGPVA